MLSDRTIKEMMTRKEITLLTPNALLPEVFPEQIQTVSVDLRLGEVAEDSWEPVVPLRQASYALKPGEFVLGSTVEVVKLSPNIVGLVHGKSTRARQGLIVHAAGLVDPGFNGQLTLEMFNMSSVPMVLEFGMLICQISFDFLSTSPDRPYGTPGLGSHYQGQYGPTQARL